MCNFKLLMMKKRSIKDMVSTQQIQISQQLVFIKGGSGMTSETEIVEFEEGGSGTAN